MDQQKLPSYYPFAIPPSLKLCDWHRKCTQFGSPEESGSECQCCDEAPKKQLKLLCPISWIYDINEAVGFYFSYIKIMSFALLITMLVTGIYSLVEIYNQCYRAQCVRIYNIPIPKMHVFFKLPLIILNGVVILLLYVILAFLFYQQAYLHQRNVCHQERPSDLSVLLSGLDHHKITLPDLREALVEFQVQDIILTHRIKKYMKQLALRSFFQARLEKYLYHKQEQKANRIQRKIESIDDRLLHIKNKMNSGQECDLRTDKVIITFSSAMEKKNFEESYKMGLWQNIYHTFCGGSPLMINEECLYIEHLGEPNELIWENFEIKSRQRYLRILVSNLLSIVFLLGTFVVILYLSKGERDQDVVGDVFLSILFAILIEVVNNLYNIGIDGLTDWEGRYTLTGKISIKLYKNCFGFFLNTTLLPFLLFEFKIFQPDEDDIIRDILSVFFISNLISPIVGLYLSPKYLIRLYQRRKIRKQANDCLLTQIKANQIIQKIDFMLDERYAIVIQLFMNCMFYAAIFPIGILITIAGMLITYWSSKAWLLNFCSLPRFTFRLGHHINLISCIFPCIYAFGYSANLYMVKNESVQFNKSYSIYMAVATIPISVFFLFFGERISKKWIFSHRKSVTECLNQAKPTMQYKKLNPTTFIHSNLCDTGKKEKQQIWENLVSYVMARQSGILHHSKHQGNRKSSASQKMNDSLSSSSKSCRTSREEGDEEV